MKRKLLEFFLILSASLLLAYLVLKYEIQSVGVGFSILLIITFAVCQLQRNAAYDKFLFFIPLIICSLPFQRMFLTTMPLVVAAQFSVFPVIVSYLVKFPTQARARYSERVRPLFFPTAVFAASFLVAYILSGEWAKADWGFILSLLGSLGYAYLACVYCRDLKSFRELVWILIGIGVLQLPVMYAMSQGWTDNLPGALGKLSSESWGGLASEDGTTTPRYPGLFRDYELLAEYLDLMVLFCIGIVLSPVATRERIFSVLAILALTIAGFYTGTRAFAIGLVVGFTVLVILFVLQPTLWKRVKNILILGIMILSAFYFLSTQQIFSGYINRFLETDLRSGYYDSRTVVWRVSSSMIEELPFTGYGTQMMDVFIRKGGGQFTSPHSLYFSMILRAGYLGVVAIFIVILFPLLWMARILFTRPDAIYRIWAIVIVSAWCFWAVNEIKIEFIRYPFYMNVVFFIVGMFAGFYQMARGTSSNIQA